MKGPRILRAGDAACVHREYIDANLVGTCGKCGQVRSYRTREADYNRPLPSGYGDAVFSSVQASRNKGGAALARKKAIGSQNPGSNAWNDMEGQKSERMLVKGIDYL